MSEKKEIIKKVSVKLRDKIAGFAYKKGKKKLTAEAYGLKGIRFYDDNTASVEFYEIPDLGEYIGYGEWAAKDTPIKSISISKKELEKLLV